MSCLMLQVGFWVQVMSLNFPNMYGTETREPKLINYQTLIKNETQNVL
jgi:hypothetical protein